jgi:hypothetical protein
MLLAVLVLVLLLMWGQPLALLPVGQLPMLLVLIPLS